MLVRTLAFAALVAIATLAPENKVVAQEQGGSLAVTVLDVNAIRRDATAVKSIRDQIIAFRNSLQSEIQQENQALQTAQQELAQKQALLAPEAFAEERRKFEQRVVEVQKTVQERRRALEISQANAMQVVENALNEIVAAMARTNGYGIVLRRDQVVLASTALDITPTVLNELNTRLTTVKVEPPASQ